MLKKYSQLFLSALIISDSLVILSSWIGAYYVRFHSGWIPLTEGIPSFQHYRNLLIPVWTKKDDDRRTRLGVVLRKTSLDELPQFYNVFAGDMSMVGPRPERPMFVEDFKKSVPQYMLRLKMKAGITGWAQVNGWRGNTSVEKRIEHDLYYIRHWSLFFDLKILIKTLWNGLINRHAY